MPPHPPRQLIRITIALWAGSAAIALAADRRPNIVIIMPDQMRGQAMGVAGNTQVRTPHIDRLAESGVYLPNTIANNPVCCPARATILTGTYPHEHGMIVNDLKLRGSTVTLAERLADAGYATGFVGKWHLEGGVRMPGFVPPGPRRQGFAFWAANVCNHNHFKSIYFRDTDEPIHMDRYETEVWTDEAIGFIRANKDRPFFLWWTCGPPHNPYGAPEEFEKLYDPATLQIRPNWTQPERFGTREDIAKYYAMITDIDEQVGRITQELEILNLTQDTLVLFISDHGDMLGSHGGTFKCKPWEESIRVPGILAYPRKIRAGQKRDLLFSHVDIAPTVLAWCSLDVPAGLHGRDLHRQLNGESDQEPEAVFMQIYEPRPQTQVPAGWRGVRTKRYTYARLEDKPWLLFDLQEDPYQMKNLVDQPETATIQAQLDRLIQQEIARTGDSWSVNLPETTMLYRGPAVVHPRELADKEPEQHKSPTVR
ncbi:MAG: sulfatase [Phycisphaerae bacterium]|nr:sulfatase [Phycisphaerae bacterium]